MSCFYKLPFVTNKTFIQMRQHQKTSKGANAHTPNNGGPPKKTHKQMQTLHNYEPSTDTKQSKTIQEKCENIVQSKAAFLLIIA